MNCIPSSILDMNSSVWASIICPNSKLFYAESLWLCMFRSSSTSFQSLESAWTVLHIFPCELLHRSVPLIFFPNDRAHVTRLFISIFVKFLLWSVGFAFDLRIHKRLTLLYNNLYFVPLCLLARSSSLKHARINTEETCKLPLKCSYIVSIFFLSFLTWTKVYQLVWVIFPFCTRDKSYAPQAFYLYIADEKCGDKAASYEPFPPAESPNKR